MIDSSRALKTIITQKKYSPKIIEASALLDDTEILLSLWNNDKSVEDNQNHIKDANLLYKPSLSRIEVTLPIHRERYISDPDIAGTLSHLVSQQFYPSCENIHNLYACVQTPRVRNDL